MIVVIHDHYAENVAENARILQMMSTISLVVNTVPTVVVNLPKGILSCDIQMPDDLAFPFMPNYGCLIYRSQSSGK